jgi:hypothetical protein
MLLTEAYLSRTHCISLQALDFDVLVQRLRDLKAG